MNTVGKILVLLITAFALLFMGFAVTVYTTRTNWMDKYNAEADKLKKATEQKASLTQQIKTLTDAITAEIDAHKRERETYQTQIKDQAKNYESLTEGTRQYRLDLEKATAREKLALDEAKDRRDEVLRLRADLEKVQKEKDDAVNKEFDTQQKYIDLLGKHQTLADRSETMEKTNAELKAVLEGYGLSAEPAERRKAKLINPPQVEAVILEVDKEGKYVKISVGSDSGLLKGHQLEVYRVKPQGKYVGKIEITEVDPDRAVGRILSQFKQGTVQEGDLVAPRITASR